MFVGFDGRFRKLIQTYISTTSFSVLVEGSLTNIFRPKQGLRQGDPISPLSIYVVEILIRNLKEAVADGSLDLYVNDSATVELHLVYTSDVLLFSHASTKSITTRKIIDEFSDFSGLHINKSKIHITFSKVVSNTIHITFSLCDQRSRAFGRLTEWTLMRKPPSIVS